MHIHAWTELFRIDNGSHSVDTYYECECGAVFHVYTWEPGDIRHENLHEAGSPGAQWTRGYAQGMRRMLDGTCPERCTFTCPHGDRCRLIAGHQYRMFANSKIAIGCSFSNCQCNDIIAPVRYVTYPELS